MQIQPQKLKYELKRNVCIGFALFLFVVIGAGCACHHHQDKGPYLKIQGGQDSGGVSWSK